MHSGRGNNIISTLRELLTTPAAAALWLVVVCIAAVITVASLTGEKKFDTSILALLPDDSAAQTEAEKLAKNQLANFANQRLVFLVSDTDKTTSREAASSFSSALSRSELFTQVNGEIAAEQVDEWEAFYFPYRYHLLTARAKDQLSTPASDSTHPLVAIALARLYSPMANAVAPRVLEDPLQLFFDWQLSAQPNTAFSLQQGWLTRQVDGRFYHLLSVELAENPYSMSYQRQVQEAIQRGVDDMPFSVEVLSSGLLIHAAYGAQQAQREVSTIGVGSLAGISLLLLFVFRRVRFLLIAFLPIAIGCLFAFAVCSVIFPQLHLITLAFGAGLVGVAIDYSLHFLCAQREPDCTELKNQAASTSSGHATLQLIFPGLLLGLVSSVLAYAAQGMAPFPGLRQMAVFSACGLLGAWLTVVCWVPRLPIPPCRSEEARNMPAGFVRTIERLLQHWPSIGTKRAWLPLASVIFVVAIIIGVVFPQMQTDDDIRRLQTSPDSLLQEEADVQRLINSVSGGQYFVLSAADEQTLLQLAEELGASLEPLLSNGGLTDYYSIAKSVPSIQRQQQHRQLLQQKVYGEDGLVHPLANALDSPALADKMQSAFDEVDAAPLSLQQWLNDPVSELQRYLWLGEQDNQFHMIVALSGISDNKMLGELDTIAAGKPGVEFVDNVADITAVLQHHREQLQYWLVIAYVVVLLLLTWRYGLSAWRVIAAPALASLMTLAIFSLFSLPVNIFNLLALLLVLGIGLDASIFLRESGRSSYAWIAVTLSALTTLMAFGLLALSQTPVLHQFGITVLLGICGVWLLTPCFVAKSVSTDRQTA